jgi:RNA polymerase sigma-70 factor, ECF subfamily
MTHASAAAREVARPLSTVGGVPTTVPEFDELYDNYADFVWRNARRLGVAPSALDDVVQDVFLVAHRKRDALAQPEALRAWMLSIVIRVVRDYRRGLRRKDPRHRSTADVMEPDTLADPRSINPLASAEQADAVRLLHRVLGELDDAKREAFVLAELEEMTELEIAEVLGERVNTVHSRLRAARIAFDQAVLRHRSRDEWRLR